MQSNHRSAHLLAFNKSGAFLLVKRADVPVWVIPGGTAEANEEPEQTAVREFGEETRITVRPQDIQLVARYLITKTNEPTSKLLYTCTLSSSAKPELTSESVAFGFFTLQNLPSPISLYEQRKISEAVAKNTNVMVRFDSVNTLSELFAFPVHTAVWLLLKYSLAQVRRKNES